jgi:hypothetical protein
MLSSGGEHTRTSFRSCTRWRSTTSPFPVRPFIPSGRTRLDAHYTATSVDSERAFSQCTLMIGKLRTRLSDDSFRAGCLLRSWSLNGLLPTPEEMAAHLRLSKRQREEVLADVQPRKSPRISAAAKGKGRALDQDDDIEFL